MPETISVNDVIVNGEPTIAPDTEESGTGTAYTTDDPASTTINDTDYVPMSDTDGNRKKSLWSTIIDKIKTAIWKPNTNAQDGYVASGSGQNNKAWRTDDSGNPAWRDYDNLHFAVVTSLDANTVDEDGIWYVRAVPSNVPVNYYGVFWNIKSMGTPFQMFFPDAVRQVYKRWYTSGAWTAWQLIEAGDSTKLPLAGGTISGNITYKHPSVDASKANNNVSSTQYQTTFNMLDVSNRIYARMEGKVQSNGNIGAYWYVRNYNTSGEEVAQKGIEMAMAKDGTFSYGISDPDKFRSAIHAAYSSANNGVADNATKVNNWYSSRPTSANVQFGDGFLRYFLATSSMSEGKPTIGDGHIIDLAWDYNNGYDVQLAIGNGSSGIQCRGQVAGVWQDWLTFIHSANIALQTVKRAKELNYATNTTDLNTVNGNGWYSIAEAKNAIYDGHKPLAINWHWGIDIRTKGITYTQINGYQILTTENGVPKTGGTFTGAVTISNPASDTPLLLGNSSRQGSIVFYNGVYQTFLRGNTANASIRLPASNGTLALQSSSRRIKENIRDITEEEAKKLLDIDVVKFDYKEGWGDGKENHAGFIAEDVQKIIPETVIVHKNYDPNLPIDVEYNFPPEMDYQKFIPYLVKMVQMQQEQINELKAEIKALKEG